MNLITKQEVIELAFSHNDQIDITAIGESTIEAVELKFIAPTLGDIYLKLKQGVYMDRLDERIKPALAHYVKYSMIPELAIRSGNVGVTINSTKESLAANESRIALLQRNALNSANIFFRDFLEYITTHCDDFPEFDLSNIRSRSIYPGGVIISNK